MTFKERRKSMDLTQEEVATYLGIGRTAVSMWEVGESFPRTDMLPKLAALYDCTIDELLGAGEESDLVHK